MEKENQKNEEVNRLRAYLLVWSLYQLVLDWNYGSLARHGTYEYVQYFLLFALALFLLSPATTLILHPTVDTCFGVIVVLARCGGLLARIPTTFDSEYLQFWTDLTLAAAMAFDATEFLPEAMRWELGLFYAAAAFWKINSAFLNPKYSCATTYIVQLVCAFGLPTSFARALVPVFGVLTIVLEGAIGVTAFFERTAKLSVLLCLALHIGITLTPPPNNIAGFGVVAIVRFLWLLPASTFSRSRKVTMVDLSLPVLSAAVLLGLSSHSRLSVSSFDWPAGIFGAVAAVVALALLPSKNNEPAVVQCTKKPLRRILLVGGGSCLIVLWAFGTIILGLLDGASPNMFSNVRMSGGSNHYILPTGLLQQWFYNESSSVFGGGILRVEASNSTALNKIHPGEMTAILSKRTRKVLAQDLAYTGRFYNPLVANVVGTHVMPRYADRPKYTLPAFELHRVLRQNNSETRGAIELTVTKLDGPTGDETWRRHSGDRTVKLVFAPFYPHLASCEVVRHRGISMDRNERDQGECIIQDYFHLTFIASRKSNTWLNHIGDKLQMWNSVVVYDDDDDTELHCYGS